ncbi:MAG: hypothetical protein GXY87_03785 [Tissierellia bacterium]|nr:hypothetical protein [Tissierellia bacterium]
MTVVELIALNQQRYDKILVLETKEKDHNPYIGNMLTQNVYSDMNLVDTKYYTNEAVDYFLLDQEGLKELVFVDQEINPDLEESDKVLVILV